ncbi:MAG: helix-turn-helix domain-containing protein [Aureispira sp.]|nr:helix-turn-helix domain-containing protein [Aureispira sp.]
MMELSFDQLPAAVHQLSQKLEAIEKLLLNRRKDQSTEEKDELLTVQQAAEFLILSVPTIYSKVSRGELPVMKQGKRLYFSKEELMEYLKAGRKKTNTELEAEAEAYLAETKKGLNYGK